jgi:copper chaperone CopZ
VVCALAWGGVTGCGEESATPAVAEAETKTIVLSVGGMHCEACVEAIERSLAKIDGVTAVKVEYPEGRATVKTTGDASATVFVAAIERLGYTAVEGEPTASAAAGA